MYLRLCGVCTVCRDIGLVGASWLVGVRGVAGLVGRMVGVCTVCRDIGLVGASWLVGVRGVAGLVGRMV